MSNHVAAIDFVGSSSMSHAVAAAPSGISDTLTLILDVIRNISDQGYDQLGIALPVQAAMIGFLNDDLDGSVQFFDSTNR